MPYSVISASSARYPQRKPEENPKETRRKHEGNTKETRHFTPERGKWWFLLNRFEPTLRLKHHTFGRNFPRKIPCVWCTYALNGRHKDQISRMHRVFLLALCNQTGNRCAMAWNMVGREHTVTFAPIRCNRGGRTIDESFGADLKYRRPHHPHCPPSCR